MAFLFKKSLTMAKPDKREALGEVNVPDISSVEAVEIAQSELEQLAVDVPENTIPREKHPRTIKKDYRLKAILWSALLAIAMISGMITDKNKWGNIIPNILRMMSGQSTEPTGLTEPSESPITPLQTELPVEETPAPTQEMAVTPEEPTLRERLTYPANNLIEDETLCRNPNGLYNALVEPIEVDGLKLFRITVVPVDADGRAHIRDLMLPVHDPAERIKEANSCLAGMPNGEGQMVYYVPVRESEKASEVNTSSLKLIDYNEIFYLFPGLVIVDEQGEQHLSDKGKMQLITFKNPKGVFTSVQTGTDGP